MIPGSKTAGMGVSRILLGADQIARRVADLGEAISRDYAGRALLLVGALRGGAIFLADLTRRIAIPHEFDFISISSYGSSTSSNGQPEVVWNGPRDLSGRHVLLVEDIYDTGHTIDAALQVLGPCQPASLDVCVLLAKDCTHAVTVPVRYTGFTVPDIFVVGYGLDRAGQFRHLPHVAVLEP